MRIGPEQVGRRGILVLGVAGAVGVALAVHGYGRGAITPAMHAPSTISATAPLHAQRPEPLRRLTHHGTFAFRIDQGTTTARTEGAISVVNVQVVAGTTVRTVPVSTGDSSSAQTATYAFSDRLDVVDPGEVVPVVTDPSGMVLG